MGAVRQLAGLGRDAPVILMYHRVADPPYDPWGLSVSPQRFREQLAELRQHRVVLSMGDFVAALDAGAVPPRATALTFDDGYADNAIVAKPLLEELAVPATVFLTTGQIAEGRPFWWDELAALVVAGTAAADFDFEIAGVRLAAQWPAQAALPPDLARWRIADRTADPRRQAYARLWEALQRLPAADREAAMTRLREMLGKGPLLVDMANDLPMTTGAARCLASRYVSLGAHGRSHIPLPALLPDARREEIEAGQRDLAAFTGSGASGFAYPHGEWDPATRAMVIEAGFAWAVGTQSAKVDPARFDRFALPRVGVGNWSGAALRRRLALARA